MTRSTEAKECDYCAISATNRNNTTAPSGFAREITSIMVRVSTSLGAATGEPTDVISTDGTGNRMPETDYNYDGATFRAMTSVPGLPLGTHDQTNNAANSSALRGNMTGKVQKFLRLSLATVTCPVALDTTKKTSDETEKVVASEDSSGDATCGDTGSGISFHKTTYLCTKYKSVGIRALQQLSAVPRVSRSLARSKPNSRMLHASFI